jgi:hypothetical protein
VETLKIKPKVIVSGLVGPWCCFLDEYDFLPSGTKSTKPRSGEYLISLASSIPQGGIPLGISLEVVLLDHKADLFSF